MSNANEQANACVSCHRSEEEVPVTEWRLSGRSFWICPDCLPQLIHHRAQVMSRWGLSSLQTPGRQGL
jgi:hypothetical protein